MVENIVGLPTVDFEWMVTDSCGLGNMGATKGPKMNLYNSSYVASQTVYAGNAASFQGNVYSFGRSDADSALHNDFGSQSLTIMSWVKWADLGGDCGVYPCCSLIEFSSGLTSRGFLTWLYIGGLWYDICRVAGVVAGYCGKNGHFFTPVINQWYHVAFTYDGSENVFRSFLDSTLRVTFALDLNSTSITW